MSRMRRFLFPYLALEATAFRLLSIDAGPVITTGFHTLQGGLLGWTLLRVSLAFRQARRARDNRSGINLCRLIVTNLLPGPGGAVILGELSIWMSFGRLAGHGWRRRKGDFSYHCNSTMLMWLLLFVVTAPAELLLFEVLIPWTPVRWFLLAATVYSLFWFVGMFVGSVVYPHHAGSTHLELRGGAMTSIRVPYSNISAASIDRSPVPARPGRIGPHVVDGTLYLAVEGRADVRLELSVPQPIPTSLDAVEHVRTIRAAADDTSGLTATIESHLPKR